LADRPAAPYLVLARKYRPQSFQSLIGQGAMVQTLGNAFHTGRIHHAFILTGVRGVGKTTTARILARAFNYVDDTGPHPTLDLGKEGEHCRAIIEGRHVDVHEMDAASNTGIDDIREIIDSVKYGPVAAPYKVFIIDEVHMLSNQAFNGLLKTLEEPPPYVKFIFATTEIRKVPVTILSRCQRFDLRRITPEVMTRYLAEMLQKEHVAVEADALSMIVRAGEGSVRDCLSLLDQAIAHGAGAVTAENVRMMLGLADRAAVLDLFESLMRGDIAGALGQTRALYDAGADAETILADLASLTHLVTRLKIVPAAADDHALSPDERSRGAVFAEKLGMRALTRTWQILTRGIEEVSRAGNAIQAAEMVLVRLTHAADLPTPDEVIARLRSAQATAPRGPEPAQPLPPRGNGGGQARMAAQPVSMAQGEPRHDLPTPERLPDGPRSYADLVALAGRQRDLAIKHALETDLRPVSFAEGRIEVALTDHADPGIIATLSARLKAWTGRPWMVMVSRSEAAQPTVREERRREEAARLEVAQGDELVQAVLDAFPGARIVDVRMRSEPGHGPLPAADDHFEAPDGEPEEE